MIVFLDGEGEPLSGRMPVDHELVAVDPGSAGPRRAGNAGEPAAAEFCGVDLVDAVAVIPGSSPDTPKGDAVKLSNVVGIFSTDLTRQAG